MLSSLAFGILQSLLYHCNRMCADYLFQQDKHYDVTYDTGDKVIQCGRHNDIFKFWLLWRAKVSGLFIERSRRGTFKNRLNQFQGNGRICQTSGTLHGTDSIPHPASEGETPSIPADCRRSRVHKRLLLVRSDPIPHHGAGTRTRPPPRTGFSSLFLRNSSAFLISSLSPFQITPILKGRMMTTGTLMVGYQPQGQLPNFFRCIISNQAVTEVDVDFLVEEMDRLGQDL